MARLTGFRVDAARRLPNESKPLLALAASIRGHKVLLLAEQDLVREARWQNGYAYMEARGILEAHYGPNAVPEIELDTLREEFFQHEASTIKKEETDIGFYRYNRPRVYGRN